MKNYLVLLSLLAVVSCSKSGGSSTSYTYTADFDGQQKTFNKQVIASKSKLADQMYSLTITGIANSEESALALWSDKDDFTAGKTFSASALDGTTYNSLNFMSPMGSSDPSNLWSSADKEDAGSQSFQCTITEATSSYVKGTFSGTIYNSSDGVTNKVITNGQFYAKY